MVLACSKAGESVMTVSGSVKGLKKGVLYLQKVSDSSLFTVDSLEIKGDGSFVFSTPLESPEIFYLYLNKKDNNDINDRITFFGEPGNINIQTTWNAFEAKAVISGSETQKKLEEYRAVMSRFDAKNLELMQASADPKIQEDTEAMDSLQAVNDNNIRRSYLYAVNYALNNKNSDIAPYIALAEIADANIIYLDSIYHSLSPEVAKGTYGKALGSYLEGLRENQ